MAVAGVHGHRHGAALTVHHSGRSGAWRGVLELWAAPRSGRRIVPGPALTQVLESLATVRCGPPVEHSGKRQTAQQLAVDAVVIHMGYQIPAHHVRYLQWGPGWCLGAVAVGGGIVPDQVVLAVLLAQAAAMIFAVVPALTGAEA